jgi:hypothetical protein
MDNIVRFLIFSAIMLLVAFGTYGLMVNLLPEIVVNKRKKRAEGKYYELLLKTIEQGTIEEDGIHSIYNRFNEKLSNIFVIIDISYEEFLESFKFYVLENVNDEALIKKVNQKLKPILDIIKEENPYANVDERQRRVLLSIEETMKNSSTITASERTAIRGNLNELAIAFVEKQERLLRSQKLNKWTVPISIVSVLATVFFGIIQLFS